MASVISLPFISLYNGAGAKDAEKQLNRLASSVKSFARNVISAFGGVGATAGSVMFLRNAITQSRDLERQTASLKSVFGQASSQMLAFSKNGVQMGLSTTEAAKASTFLGSVLKSSGFGMEDTIKNTQKLVRLASDLATTYGYDVSEALTGMTALFRGEYDPIEKFGVAMKQAEVNTILAARGQKNLTGQQLLNAQQLIRLELLMKRSADAQGAFTRQGDSLFVQQMKLSALWDNMQATVGNRLTPALANFLEKIRPIVENFAPRLEGIFETFGELITDLGPQLNDFAEGIAMTFENISKFLKGAKPLLQGLLTITFENLDKILLFIATFKLVAGIFRIATTAVMGYKAALKLATAAQVELTAAEAIAGWRALAGVIGLAVAAFAGYVYLADKTNGLKGTSFDFFASNTPIGTINTGNANMYDAQYNAKNSKILADETKRYVAKSGKILDDETKRFKARQGQFAADLMDAEKGPAGNLDPEKNGTKTKVQTFFTSLAEEVKKQALKIKLSGLGASDALIDAVLGGSAWEASANKIIAGGTKTVDFIQRQFNKTKAGLEEIAQTAEEAAKKLQEYEKAVKAATEFADEMKDVIKELTSGGVTQSLGVFEQSIVSTFESIASKVQDAVKSELIKPDDAKSLLSYASASQVAMQAIAKQRDVLAERIQTVRELISATKSAVMGFVNITSLLETQTKTVTQSVVSVTDGIRLTLTNSMSVTEVTGSITDKFKEILAKTKQFAVNLRELKRLGLDQNLFKQIVDAGLESGGATAAAIIEGGAGTVSELNSLFADLQTAGTDIAEQTAQVMYGAGVDITNGLINGLLAQESALTAAANALASSFATAFNSSIAGALKNNLPTKTAPSVPMSTIGIGGGLTAQLNAMGFFSSGVATGSSNTLTAPQSVINLVINAQNSGMTGTELAQQMIAEIKKYERTNGAVWQAAN